MPRSKQRARATTRRTAILREIPQVNDILVSRALQGAIARHGRAFVATLARERLAGMRAEFRDGGLDTAGIRAQLAALGSWIESEAARRTATSIRPVINATGVVLHTNLGRAPLSDESVRRMGEVARSYTTLEYDLARGRRGSRSSHLERLLLTLFPGRATHVVNNNAAALFLALNTLAEGRQVIVSRGELVEIGGSFRIPEIMRKSGALLREVGTTNKTRIADYERAMGPDTGLLLKVHPSNYRIVGFTAQVALKELAALGRRRRIPVLMDQGSGNLLDLKDYGIRDEAGVHEGLRAGADVICYSGDKLLGGPQAGLLVGRPRLIQRMRENPLSRVLRVDKLTYAGLEATLLEYLRGTALSALPVPRMIAMTREAIDGRARRLCESLQAGAPGRIDIALLPGWSVLGGGAAPDERLPTTLLALRSGGLSARTIENRLRGFDPPIIARIEGKRVLLDLRTVPEREDDLLARAIASLDADETVRR